MYDCRAQVNPFGYIMIDKMLGIVDVKHIDGSMFTDTCHVLINGTGVINKWKCKS